MDEGCRTWNPDGVMWGLVLIAVGVLFTLENQGLLPGSVGHGWWVYIVIAFGLARLVTPRDAAAVGDGVSTTLIGVWLAANVYHWYGLTWTRSWPLVFVAVGSGYVARALAALVLPDRRRSKEGADHAR